MPEEDPSALYRAFAAKWGHPDYPLEPDAEEVLAGVEEELALALPRAYRRFMLEIGPVICGGTLLRAITTRKLDVRDLSEFHAARDVGRATIAWRRSRLPDDLVTIASDGCGNQFCLRFEASEAPVPDAPVWLWRHESDEAVPVAPSFVAWLASLLAIDPVPED